jgi:5-methylcytosine-specific restriction endonuclease McrA
MSDAELRRLKAKEEARRRHRTAYWQQNARSSYRCPDCGRLESHPHVARLEVHHKDEDPFNGAPSNLVALCRHCHQVRHGMTPTTALGDWKARIHSLGTDSEKHHTVYDQGARS